MCEQVNTTPCFSPEAQQTFAPGARVYEVGSDHLDPWGLVVPQYGTFVGWSGDDEHAPKLASVDWDGGSVTEVEFDNLRNLYR